MRHIVFWKMEYGYNNPYAPREIMEEIEAKRVSWCEEAVLDFMYIPKPYHIQSKPKLWEEFLPVRANWNLGRSIHIDRVVVRWPGKKNLEWSSNIWGPDGKMVQIPHPDFLCWTVVKFSICFGKAIVQSSSQEAVMPEVLLKNIICWVVAVLLGGNPHSKISFPFYPCKLKQGDLGFPRSIGKRDFCCTGLLLFYPGAATWRG